MTAPKSTPPTRSRKAPGWTYTYGKEPEPDLVRLDADEENWQIPGELGMPSPVSMDEGMSMEELQAEIKSLEGRIAILKGQRRELLVALKNRQSEQSGV